jgi:uncharacterized membrane protein
MSLRAFHGVFIAAGLSCLSFTAVWASGRNAAGLKSPWALGLSLLGAALMLPYLLWYLKKVRLPR